MLHVTDLYQWLVKNGKSDKALAVLAKYHANGKADDPLVVFEYHEIRNALANEAAAHHAKYSDFIKGSGNRKRLAINVIIAFGTNWVGNGIISYYLSPVLATLGVTSTATQLQILVGLQCWNRERSLSLQYRYH